MTAQQLDRMRRSAFGRPARRTWASSAGGGMVGSVLVDRMRAERDFDLIEPVFFSTTQAGGNGPQIGRRTAPVGDAQQTLSSRLRCAHLSCQGGDYTSEIYLRLRAAGWNGYWIDGQDAAHGRRRRDRPRSGEPRRHRPRARRAASSNFIGGNCTVSLMLMAHDGPVPRRPRRVDDAR